MRTDTTIVLEAQGVRAVVAPSRGAAIESLTVDGIELLGGIPPLPGLPERFYSGCFVMAPFTGLLAGGLIAGAPSLVPGNTPRGAEHGTVYDAEWTVESVSDAAVSLRTDLGARWAYAGEASLAIMLTPDELSMRLAVHAAEEMPVAVGLHPWFRRELGSTPAELTIHPRAASVFDEHMMATDRTGAVPGRPWDHVLTGVEQAPIIRWPELTLALVSPTSTWVVYEEAPEAFCVEPISAPAGALAEGAEIIPAGTVKELPFALRWHRTPARDTSMSGG